MCKFLSLFLIICCYWSCQVQQIGISQKAISSEELLNWKTGATIYTKIKNPSFEDSPAAHSTTPKGWIICNFNAEESPPDIHKSLTGFFDIKHLATEGDQFLGLVARDNGTKEHVGQALPKKMVEGKNYAFSVDLAHSKRLRSLTRKTRKHVLFDKPLILKIWGGRNVCSWKQLLFVSEPVNHTDWKTYLVEFKAERPFDTITFQVVFDEADHDNFYNGNILIDNVSPIYQVGK